LPRITRVYTRTGDDGTTGLASGQRVPKDSHRMAVLGALDELNSVLGMVLASAPTTAATDELRPIQNDIFHLGAALCVPEEDKGRYPMPAVARRHVERLEAAIDTLTERLGPLENFLLPGGTPSAALLHLARSVCRRAERDLVSLGRETALPPHTLEYLNRLSDLLFVLARWENQSRGVPDPLWDSRA
jgi:cob(I)alamin adenosyltransferase